MTQNKKTLKIAVVGLPNAGKTTFLNTLTNSNLRTANFAGSTTSKHEIAFFFKNRTLIFVDLPGFDSLQNDNNDLSKKTIDFLKSENYDIILHIANGDFPYFCNILDKDLRSNLDKKIVTAINFPSFKKNVKKARDGFEKAILFCSLSKNNCEKILDLILEESEGKSYEPQNILKFKDSFSSPAITKIIDKIALSKIFGIPFFFGIMFLIFWLSFIVGTAMGDFLLSGFDYLIELTEASGSISAFFKAFIKSVLIGVGTVIGFMPTIIICVSLIGLMEQTGYITRICFLMDKMFEKFNLGGKSLIPLIIGAGCSITAYMSARMINNPKEKFLTMVIVGFVPCTAKLAVFMLFCLALFGEHAPIAISVVYLGGFFIGLLCAKLLGLFIQDDAMKEKTRIEIFNYRMPILKNVLKTGYERTMDYIKNAATFIAIFSAIISLLSLIGYENGSFVILSEDGLSRSFIGQVGHFLSPLFAPMDFDFKMIISLITGLIAKETAIATLAVLYSSGVDELVGVIASEIGLRHAVSYLVFMFFYLPCVSATASFHRELKSWHKTIFLILFTTALAYSFASLSNLIFLSLGY